MERLSAKTAPAPERPIRVIQFGEGNFLRAFVDYMIDFANEKTDFNGSVMLIKPIPMGTLFPAFKEQDYRYTVMLRGLVDGKPVEQSRVVTSVAGALDAYSEYETYAGLARLDTLRFVVSNTTEAGIVLDKEDQFELCPPKSYPGKLTKFLYERAEAFDYAPDKGLIIPPVELIDDNGIQLHRCVRELASIWKLGPRFEQWLEEACVFTSTLVDRIVTGYPRGEDKAIWEKLGYEDHLLDTAEPFGLWVIESPKDISHELPLPQCGMPVIFTDNQKPYKQRKVRILNGAHTSFVPMAFQYGMNTVVESMNDPVIRHFMEKTIYDEVIPTLSLPREDLLNFAEAVTGRFANPFIQHMLLSICLNCVSKWRARCLPSLTGYYEANQCLPEHLTFSMAAMISLYSAGKLGSDGKLHCCRGNEEYLLQDDAAVLQFFDKNHDTDIQTLVPMFLGNLEFFGQDLNQIPGFQKAVVDALEEIRTNGMKATVLRRFPIES